MSNDKKNEVVSYGAPESAVKQGRAHFGYSKVDQPYCHGFRLQVVGDKIIKHLFSKQHL